MGASSRCRLFMRNFSFEGTDAQRTVTSPRGGWRAIGRPRVYGKRRSRRYGLVVAHGFQKCRGRSKKHVSRDGAAEIQQAVIVAGWPAHEHVFEHLFDGAGRAAVADEIGAKFPVPGSAEWHVVAQDLDLFPVLDDGCECVVRRGWLDGIVQFDIRQLGAADDSFLHLRGQRIPPVKIVEIFLHDNVTAAGERGVFLADHRGVDHRLTPGILRPIDETQEITVVKIAEAMNFVHRRNSISDARHDLRCQLETQIHALRADVENQVAWRRNRMASSRANFAEHAQFRWQRRSKEPVPRVGSKTYDAGKAPFKVPKLHST